MNLLSLSADGYVRLWAGRLAQIALTHLCSGRDADSSLDRVNQPNGAGVCGYTEWVNEGQPVISIGWDWHLSAVQNVQRCVRSGLPCSNVMLVDSQGNDIGPDSTSLYLAHWLDKSAAVRMAQPWYAQVALTCGLS